MEYFEKKYTAGVVYALTVILFFCQGCCKMADTMPDTNTLSQADKEFEIQAAHADINITALADMAASASFDSGIRQYAQLVADSHRKAYKELEAFAAWHILLPAAPDSTQLVVLQQLAQLSASAFDSMYLFTQKGNLIWAAECYRKELETGRLHTVTEHAAKHLPVIHHNLDLADSILQSHAF